MPYAKQLLIDNLREIKMDLSKEINSCLAYGIKIAQNILK
jgi:hypothetical protein